MGWVLDDCTIYAKIDNKEIIVNRSGQPLYCLSYGSDTVLGIVSPKLFADFAVATNLYITTTALNRETMIKAASIVQSAFHKTKTNIPSQGGTKQIHYYRLTNSEQAKAKLSLYLIPIKNLPNNLREKIDDIGVSDVLAKT
ncbi:conjugal transfer nickase/helicase domain-containing protein [Suttonella ornithocola]|uniref:conjugal transfer nickase/helicase domain-containing protein n=1 Tax=Suttonella ornithocola TaxID=279832 RepID=UPI000933A397|nr:DNA-binding domain-containing protein [Suttonella ornithocola]